MKVAEELYSAGLISYPRTESTKYADSYDITSVLQQMSQSPQWGKTVSTFLRQNDNWVAAPQQGHDAGDHPPITPCAYFGAKIDVTHV